MPEIYEDFSEARKEGFLKMKDIKESGKKVVGIFCTYTPKEVIMAADAVAVGLCGTSEEPIPDAEKDLPRNLCPLIKSSYGFAVTDKCPYFYFSDLLVGETTCDGKKKMFEFLGDIKPVHVMQLPQTYDCSEALKLWKNEIIRLKERLERDLGVEITDEKLKAAIKLRNQERKVLREFYNLSMACPPPMTGYEMHQLLYGSEFKFDRLEFIESMRSIIDKIRSDYEAGSRSVSDKAPRIMVTGCPTGGVADKVIKAIEDSGGVVVCYENCGGAKEKETLVDESKDCYDALAEKYLNIACSVMSPNQARYELLSELADRFKVDGVVEIVLQACHTYNVEAFQVKKHVTGKLGLPYLYLETDYSKSDSGQILTRVGAFLEMIDK